MLGELAPCTACGLFHDGAGSLGDGHAYRSYSPCAPQAAPAGIWALGSEQTATSICLVAGLKREGRSHGEK